MQTFNRPINNYDVFNYKYGMSGMFLCKLIGGPPAPFVFLNGGAGGPSALDCYYFRSNKPV
jgi:hypothetical protein